MRILAILAISFYAMCTLAQTSGKPLQLNAGKYSLECWSAFVTKTAAGEIQRYDDYSKGMSTIVIQGETSVEYAQFQSEDSVSNSVSKTTTSDLGNGVFKQFSEDNTTESYGNETHTTQSKYINTVKVDGNKTQNLTIKINNDPEKPGVGELVWKKMSDGRIVVQNYMREKMSYTRPDGTTVERLVSNSQCIYTPVN